MDTEPVGCDITLTAASNAVSQEHEEEVMEHVCREAVPALIRDAKLAGLWVDWSTLRIEVVTMSSEIRVLRASASGVGHRDPVQAEVALR